MVGCTYSLNALNFNQIIVHVSGTITYTCHSFNWYPLVKTVVASAVSYCPTVLSVWHWPGESVLFNASMWCLLSSRWVDCMLEQQDCLNIHWDIVSTSTFPTTIILWLCAQSSLLITLPSFSKIFRRDKNTGSFHESNWYQTSAIVTELRRHLLNMKVIFNS